MDVLADVVSALRTGPATSGRTDVRGPWGLRFAHSFGATFHLVLQGTAWLLPPGGTPVAMGPGDVVLMPRGLEHALADHPESPLVDFDPAVEKPIQGDGARSLLLCGTYRLDRERPHPVLSRLPDTAEEGRAISLRPAQRKRAWSRRGDERLAAGGTPRARGRRPAVVWCYVSGLSKTV